MRHLSIKQKKILRAFYDRTQSNAVDGQTVRELEKLNDFETLWQACNRFLWDLQSAQRYRGDMEEVMKGRY